MSNDTIFRPGWYSGERYTLQHYYDESGDDLCFPRLNYRHVTDFRRRPELEKCPVCLEKRGLKDVLGELLDG